MSATARPPRMRRGRVMIVGATAGAGEPPEFSRISSYLQQPPVVVKNLFDALGEITIAPASSPIATVLVADRQLHSHSTLAIGALRKIDPSLRVVLIAQSQESLASNWIDKGLDDCVAAPVSLVDMQRLFDEDMLATAGNGGAGINAVPELSAETQSTRAVNLDDLRQRIAAAGKDDPVETSQPREARLQESSVPSAIEAPVANVERAIDVDASISQSAPTQATVSKPATEYPRNTSVSRPESMPFSQQRLAQGLGDTDLVEAILSPTKSLRDTALLLIVQQTQWTDLQLHSDDVSTRDKNSAACAEVSFDNTSFGWLATSKASAAHLQPWADWLARWLALDRAHQQNRLHAYQDDLTGAWNRRFFNTFLSESIDRASKARRPVTVMVFDIDNFKSYNDEFGHAAGDEILCETVRLLNSVIRQGDRVCRIGGDEFVVVFADPEGPRALGSSHPETVETIARRFQDQVCKMRFPKLGIEALGTLSISAGLATYPWDGKDAATLLQHADQLAMESKRKGKNVITLGKHATSE